MAPAWAAGAAPAAGAAVRGDEIVFFVEGEKDADAIAALGFAATTHAGGAGKWRPEYAQALRGGRAAGPPAQEPMPMRASQASRQAPAAEVRNRPSLVTPRQLCALYPIKPRTLKYWVQHSADRQVSRQGRRRTIPGNGLAPAIVRKGRLIFIDEDLFLVWLYGRGS